MGISANGRVKLLETETFQHFCQSKIIIHFATLHNILIKRYHAEAEGSGIENSEHLLHHFGTDSLVNLVQFQWI